MSRTHKYLLDKIFHEGGGCFYYSLIVYSKNECKQENHIFFLSLRIYLMMEKGKCNLLLGCRHKILPVTTPLMFFSKYYLMLLI